jgi:nucleotide-binding universal stress UspA family protein
MHDAPQQALPPSAGPIIAATDGSPDADAAIIAAQLLGAHTNASIQVVSALEPIVIPSMGWDTTPVSPDVYVHRRTALREAILEQLRRLVPSSIEYPVSLIDGDTAPVLARVAHERRARLLLLGRGRHSLVDRLLMGETVPRVLQLADVPVFAAESGIAALPRRILIATDFSPYSLYASRVALSLVDRDATLYLAHVTPRPEKLGPGLEWMAEGNGLSAAFDQMRTEIGAEHMHVETAILSGSPGRALVDFASSTNVDLVVSGTHGYGFFNRLVLGSVATQLVRGAPCSVLAVPGSAAERAATRAQIAGE